MNKALICLGCLLAGIQLGFSTETADLMVDCCDDPSSVDSIFQKGRWEIGVNSGLMFSPFISDVQKHTVNYTSSGLQTGYMFSTPGESSWYRGNFEMLAEMFGGAVTEGSGNYVFGGMIWFRYNFVPEGWRVKPFTGIGLGAETTDIDRTILGQDINFNLNASVGLRYIVNSHWSANLEWRYQHFSDAGMTKVNRGTNAQGFLLGISRYF